MKKKEISVTIKRSKDYQTVEHSTVMTIDEKDDEEQIRMEESISLNNYCLRDLEAMKKETEQQNKAELAKVVETKKAIEDKEEIELI